MNRFPKSKELIDIFISKLTSQFSILEKTEILRFVFNNQKYMAYFKCVSYAGNPYPPNSTRAQLPQREEFDSLMQDERFLFLGYDVNNDLFVCWDPTKARGRLNKKKYVSFFCRQNIQNAVQEGNVSEARLSNGDVYVLFKSSDVARFFEMIEIHFPDLKQDNLLNESEVSDLDVSNSEVEGVLNNVSDDIMVQNLIDELIEEGKGMLSIVSTCSNAFGETYPAMYFKEWNDVIKSYVAMK